MVKLRWAHQECTWEIREQSLRGDWKTHASAQDDRVLSIVGDDDKPAGGSPRVTKERQTDRRTSWPPPQAPFRATGRHHRP
jgi:hypothetical protein